jgi:hypothetical protein
LDRLSWDCADVRLSANCAVRIRRGGTSTIKPATASNANHHECTYSDTATTARHTTVAVTRNRGPQASSPEYCCESFQVAIQGSKPDRLVSAFGSTSPRLHVVFSHSQGYLNRVQKSERTWQPPPRVMRAVSRLLGFYAAVHKCPRCGSQDLRLSRDRAPRLYRLIGFEYYRCRDCDGKHLWTAAPTESRQHGPAQTGSGVSLSEAAEITALLEQFESLIKEFQTASAEREPALKS